MSRWPVAGRPKWNSIKLIFIVLYKINTPSWEYYGLVIVWIVHAGEVTLGLAHRYELWVPYICFLRQTVVPHKYFPTYFSIQAVSSHPLLISSSVLNVEWNIHLTWKNASIVRPGFFNVIAKYEYLFYLSNFVVACFNT